jgi:hypothetical protein
MRRDVLAMVAIWAVLLAVSCSAPPQKEIDRAQGAIDAARAAGAEQYAQEPFAAATAAMQQTHDAVQQRDYRLALSRAIDANERALEAAREAANGKARARGDAEAAIARLSTAIRQLETVLKAADSPRGNSREAEAGRRVRADAERALQEARTAVAAEDYLKAMRATEGVVDKITAQLEALSEALDPKSARGAKRRR